MKTPAPIVDPVMILVVDDNKLVQQSLPALLEDRGYAVRSALNGEEAFRVVCTEPISLVITDLAMPVVDGVDLIRLIRRDPFFGRTPVIAITAYGGRRMGEAKDAGATQCFVKPIDHHSLLDAVSRLTKPW